MNKPIVRCRCGHQILNREVLRLEPYERASGAEYVYVKYRCRRCKRLGEAFIPALEWEWDIFAAPANEMSLEERDRFLDEATISSNDVTAFHRALKTVDSWQQLQELVEPSETARPKWKTEKPDGPRGVKKDSQTDGKNSEKGGGEAPPSVQRKPGN